MNEARNNLVHLPLYSDEPALREHVNCMWCAWHDVHEHLYRDNTYALMVQYQQVCRHPVLTGSGTGSVYCKDESANPTGQCKHFEPTRTTRFLRWTRLGRKPIMVPNETSEP